MILTALMAHQGKLIEHGLVTQLVAANTAAGARVHRDRVDPFKKGGIPAIAIYVPSEEIDRDISEASRPRELTRGADVEMQAFVGGQDAEVVSDLMWDLQEQIEAAMDANPYIGDTAADSILIKSTREIIEVNGASDPLVGIVTLTYAVTYRTSPAAPATLDDFRRVDAKEQIVGGVPTTAPTEDLFTVQGTP